MADLDGYSDEQTTQNRQGSSGKREPVSRAISVLSFIVDHGDKGWGVREIAEEMGLPPTTVHRCLKALEGTGLIQRDGGAAYKLGLEFFRLANRGAALMPLEDAAVSILEDLVADSGETALLGLYDPQRKLMLFKRCINPGRPLKYLVNLNEWIPLHAGATGHAILAFLDADERHEVVRMHGLPRITSKTLTTPEALERELALVRERGYAMSRGQRQEDAVSVAAPVWNARGSVVGDIAITVPRHRFDPDDEPRLAEQVRAAAAKLTESIGGKALVPSN